LQRSVFEPLPGEGRWQSALLLDGNVGIGGDPSKLLARIRQLLAPDGLLYVEAAPAEVEERTEVRLDDGTGRRGPAFLWARLGRGALRERAVAAGWHVSEEWRCGERPFMALGPSAAPGSSRTGAAGSTGSHG
jgi:hypothetical protein